MAQFDFHSEVGSQRRYVVDVQAGILDQLSTRVVAPLQPMPYGALLTELAPVVKIGGENDVFLAQGLTAIPRSELRRRKGSLSHYRDEIRRALDTLLVGF